MLVTSKTWLALEWRFVLKLKNAHMLSHQKPWNKAIFCFYFIHYFLLSNRAIGVVTIYALLLLHIPLTLCSKWWAKSALEVCWLSKQLAYPINTYHLGTKIRENHAAEWCRCQPCHFHHFDSSHCHCEAVLLSASVSKTLSYCPAKLWRNGILHTVHKHPSLHLEHETL